MTNEWRPVLNAIFYMAQFTELDDAEARRIAELLLAKPLGSLTTEQTYQSLVAALESGNALDSIVQVTQSPEIARNFLTRIIEELDALRPWPIPALQEITIARWPEFASTWPVARISIPWPAIEGRVGKTFKAVDGGEGLILMLRSGVTVGLAWPSRTGRSDTDVLTTGDSAASPAIIQELLDASALESSDITIVGRD